LFLGNEKLSFLGFHCGQPGGTGSFARVERKRLLASVMQMQ
jgi:hypothetical protein